jgi:hypothetical protein
MRGSKKMMLPLLAGSRLRLMPLLLLLLLLLLLVLLRRLAGCRRR